MQEFDEDFRVILGYIGESEVIMGYIKPCFKKKERSFELNLTEMCPVTLTVLSPNHTKKQL